MDSEYVVRREDLKRGFGWKVVSGACRLNEDRIIFVDRRMTQEDQVSFLTAKIVSLGLRVKPEAKVELDSLNWTMGPLPQEDSAGDVEITTDASNSA